MCTPYLNYSCNLSGNAPKVHSLGHLPDRRGDGVGCGIACQVEAFSQAHAAVLRVQVGHGQLQQRRIEGRDKSLTTFKVEWQRTSCTKVQQFQRCRCPVGLASLAACIASGVEAD